MQEKFTGIMPALITPFTEDGRDIDAAALEALIEMNIRKGVSGFYVGGSTGEAFLMSMEERKQFLELVVEQVNHRVKVIAHVGAISTSQAMELARHAGHCGADAVSAVPPFYYSFSGKERLAYYQDIISSTSLPMFVYHVPALTGVSMDSRELDSLLQLPGIAGMKFTAYDSYHMQRLIERYGNLTIINGHDELFLSNLSIGCKCAVGSTFNFMADIFISMAQAYEKGDTEQARALQARANAVIDVCIELGVFRAVKGALEFMGIGTGTCRKPFLPLNDKEKERLRGVLVKNKIL